MFQLLPDPRGRAQDDRLSHTTLFHTLIDSDVFEYFGYTLILLWFYEHVLKDGFIILKLKKKMVLIFGTLQLPSRASPNLGALHVTI